MPGIGAFAFRWKRTEQEQENACDDPYTPEQAELLAAWLCDGDGGGGAKADLVSPPGITMASPLLLSLSLYL